MSGFTFDPKPHEIVDEKAGRRATLRRAIVQAEDHTANWERTRDAALVRRDRDAHRFAVSEVEVGLELIEKYQKELDALDGD